MTISQSIRQRIDGYKLGELFTSESFLALGARTAIDKTLSRLVEKKEIERLARGVFTKPKINRFIGKEYPDITKVVELITNQNGEVIQIHGAEAIRRFKLSTQMPINLVYYTSGSSRQISIGNRKVKLIHTSSQRKLQHAGTKVGMAISALWYLGKEAVTPATVEQIRNLMNEEEFGLLKTCKLPAWMSSVIQHVNREVIHD
ncbi:DUF6088 family protein [Xenorhabdus szentirmaii]|uniref:Type IV toxin-antitoxin system AbiEi family antitoxin domain-containing protein n=1 Tax=Xenorhabdus szentirmaii TaxID=290112 RepID=A0AAW3YVM0_9GAMM|nr:MULTISPECIES: DUF6088 family protein [unclassified Xenorhabdus]MBD2781584.1 type IV toxin-antitoxin system AbiEi family antitoxin domain-containing protein [Xenorhabdus sp. 38]MBD2802163.1 type IV toxin-antitoxin system AbiEi family antitoxin domain-containing protein [Xenorhabdus sp. M]